MLERALSEAARYCCRLHPRTGERLVAGNLADARRSPSRYPWLVGAKMGYNLRVGLERARVDTPISIKALPAQEVEADEVSAREPDPHSLPEVVSS